MVVTRLVTQGNNYFIFSWILCYKPSIPYSRGTSRIRPFSHLCLPNRNGWLMRTSNPNIVGWLGHHSLVPMICVALCPWCRSVILCLTVAFYFSWNNVVFFLIETSLIKPSSGTHHLRRVKAMLSRLSYPMSIGILGFFQYFFLFARFSAAIASRRLRSAFSSAVSGAIGFHAQGS